MASLGLSLSVLMFVLLMSVKTTKRFFRTDSVLAFAVSPLLLIALTSTVHNGMLKLQSGSLTFLSSSRVAIAFWVVYCLIGYGVRTRGTTERSRGEYSLIFMACSLSVGAWILGIGISSNHPSDNDALSNAFILRRFADTADKSLCLVPGDVSRLVGIRFESCGSFILAHFSNLLGLVPLDKLLNSPYLLTAIFLPIGAAASWKYFSDKPNHRWIAAASSTTFLVYPYALNGLSRLTLGLALALPLIGLCTSLVRRDYRQLVLISLCLVGLGYIHLLALAIVLIYLAIVLTFSFLTIPINKATDTSLFFSALNLFVRTGVVLPAYFFFGSNYEIRSSISNIQAATAIQPPLTLGTSGSPEMAADVQRNLPSATSVLRDISLGNEWTRAQPLIFILFLMGILLLLRRGASNVPLVLSGIATYSLFLSVAIWDTKFEVYHFLFLNNWYRLQAVLVILCVIPVAVSVSHLIDHFSLKLRGQLLLATCFTAYLLSLATGASIIHTAWHRDSKPAAQIMKQFDGLKEFSNLRTLNNPADGSSWAYARSGIKLLSPNDRSADMTFAENISYLADKNSRMKACPVLTDQEVSAILAVDSTLNTFEELQREGVIERVVYHSDDVRLGLISEDFLNSCRSISAHKS